MIAPDFSLKDQKGETHNLKDYRDKWVVLYFYIKDETPGCMSEACGFRDDYEVYKNENAAILGISMDDEKSHQKFARKHLLNFPILSDTDGEIFKAYGAWGKKAFGKEGVLRETFIINPAGEIVKKYERVNPIGHASEVLNDLRALRSATSADV